MLVCSYTVPKKEATPFTKELGAKVTLGSLKAAVDKAMEYLNTDVLPPHWDRNVLFGMDISEQDTDATESDVSSRIFSWKLVLKSSLW